MQIVTNHNCMTAARWYKLFKIAEQLKTAHIAVSRFNTDAPPVSRTQHQRMMGGGRSKKNH